MIIDCHAHIAPTLTGFWQPLRYGKIRDNQQVRQVFPPSFDPPASSPEVLLAHLDQAGVERAFLVQHHLYGDQNEAVVAAVRGWPDRFVGFAYLGAFDQPDAADRLERLVERGMTVLKVEVASTRRLREDFSFIGEREWRVWERLNALRRPLILDLNASPPQDIADLHRVFDALPHIATVVCHVGGAVREGWQDRALLANRPGGWVDLSAVPAAFGPEQEYPFEKSQEVVRWAVDTFGPERVMWGTDYPRIAHAGQRASTFFTRLTKTRSPGTWR